MMDGYWYYYCPGYYAAFHFRTFLYDDPNPNLALHVKHNIRIKDLLIAA